LFVEAMDGSSDVLRVFGQNGDGSGFTVELFDPTGLIFSPGLLADPALFVASLTSNPFSTGSFFVFDQIPLGASGVILAPVGPVPEPGSQALFLAGVVLVALVLRTSVYARGIA
jgi:hypothetical protein